MIIFNTTYHVDDSLKNKFLDYIKTEYIPRAISSGILSQPRLAEILSQEEKPQGTNYALQFNVSDIKNLNRWYSESGLKLNDDFVAQFGEKVVGFSTLMKDCNI